MLRSALLLLPAVAAHRTVVLPNDRLPTDQHGKPLITGEASVLLHDGAYYFYFNDWGDCPGVDCCDSEAGCASCCFNNPPHPMQACSNPYGLNHTVRAYKTIDFASWEDLGVALPMRNRGTPGIEFRPCVVFNPATGLFVMWYEDRLSSPVARPGYSVATASTPAGPFRTVYPNVVMPGAGRIGDFNIFVDDDGTAYHVRDGPRDRADQ